MKTALKYLLYCILFFLTTFFVTKHKIPANENTPPIQILQKMIDSIESIKTIQIKLVALERFQQHYLKATSHFKISYYPEKKLYFINPEKKIEVLYVQDENNNKAIVKHPLLPFSILLDPKCSAMKKNQHYTIHELGFQYIANTIQIALSKEKEKYLQHLHYLGIQEKNNQACFLLMYESSNFDYIPYTIQTRETVVSISRKFNINEYIIRDKNNLYYEFGFLKKGATIYIPKMYCKKAFIYIDKNTYLPTSINIYDDKGLLESYDYLNVQKNTVFRENEFSKHFKGYNF